MRAQIALSDEPVPPDRRSAPLMGSPDEVIAALRGYRDLGVSHIALWPRESNLEAYLGQMDRIARDIAPALAADNEATP
jgi:hypothetical protein